MDWLKGACCGRGKAANDEDRVRIIGGAIAGSGVLSIEHKFSSAVEKTTWWRYSLTPVVSGRRSTVHLLLGMRRFHLNGVA